MSHRRLAIVKGEYFPAYVVWELTLRCDQPCGHCGSRAGKARSSELTTAEALGVVEQLAAMGAREVVLIGGEAYLHEGFLEIAAALRAAGVRPTMTTGGRGITAELARGMYAAGIRNVSVSIDGMEHAHDAIRRARGSFAAATEALGHLRSAGISAASNININRANERDLEAVYEHLRGLGVTAWQVQITTPLGRAADRPQLVLQPYDLLRVVPRIAALKRRAYADGIRLMPGNNLGYFGPEEALLRSIKEDGRDHFQGCQAGKLVMGIESDGGVKGCPSLQSYAYVGGSLAERPLAEIWNDSPRLGFARARTVDDLSGFCRTCPFAEPCMGGCSFTAHALFGRPGNNPYCHFRARTLAAQGKRERLVPTAAAEGQPFDHGLFELVVEDLDDDEPPVPGALAELVQLTRKPEPRDT
ncbi:radical SAM protein [Sorangium sp. So ce388]|uniref:radical SAM protein n=1 Tax=Sorangium sp. So ce388 TaxID=3133309 RepID=UPI003F5BC4C0